MLGPHAVSLEGPIRRHLESQNGPARGQALHALLRIQGDSFPEELERIVLDSSHPAWSEALPFISPHLEADRAIPVLLTYLNDTRHQNGAAAILSEYGAEAAPAVPEVVAVVRESEKLSPTIFGAIGPAAQAALPLMLDAFDIEYERYQSLDVGDGRSLSENRLEALATAIARVSATEGVRIARSLLDVETSSTVRLGARLASLSELRDRHLLEDLRHRTLTATGEDSATCQYRGALTSLVQALVALDLSTRSTVRTVLQALPFLEDARDLFAVLQSSEAPVTILLEQIEREIRDTAPSRSHLHLLRMLGPRAREIAPSLERSSPHVKHARTLCYETLEAIDPPSMEPDFTGAEDIRVWNEDTKVSFHLSSPIEWAEIREILEAPY